ncbi:MAG TPA: energy transducer TonB [Candidatus Acidoferrales bacterium]|nr:energy transducer TonB [Candidatus Acidoferrales bacterium]
MDIRWAEDLHLPNLVLVNSMPQPKAPVTIRWHSPVPVPKDAKIADLAPPTLAATSPDAAIVVTGISTPAPALPVVQPIESDGAPSTQNSSLTVDNANVNGLVAGEGGTLVVLSTNPNGASGVVGLPFGNRVGEFTISPDGMATGSPGGLKGAPPGGGSASKGSGGDGSVGVGDGKTGGGGGGTTIGSGTISVTGNDTGPGGRTLAAPPVAEDMVFQLAPFTKLRKNVLIVSTGPIGGGGLGVYQALQCRKIYTVFLPMPESNWTLQYCVRDDPSVEQAPKTAGMTTTIHLQPGLVPPVPESQFDFKRVPVPPEKSRKMIVLKGTIREDGTVGDVQIYSGVLPLMDEAARLAFSRWKFTPALRSGKPVAVEILVGIAATSQVQ